VAEVQDLQQQLAQARMVISQLASQLDHHRDVQNQLAGLSLCTCFAEHCHQDDVCHLFMH
jgi:hypothetical protein